MKKLYHIRKVKLYADRSRNFCGRSSITSTRRAPGDLCSRGHPTSRLRSSFRTRTRGSFWGLKRRREKNPKITWRLSSLKRFKRVKKMMGTSRPLFCWLSHREVSFYSPETLFVLLPFFSNDILQIKL